MTRPFALLFVAAFFFLPAGQSLRGETSLLVRIEDGFARVEIDWIARGRWSPGVETFSIPPGAILLEYLAYRARGAPVRAALPGEDRGVEETGAGADRVTLVSADGEHFVARIAISNPQPFTRVRIAYSLALRLGPDVLMLRLPLGPGWVGPPGQSHFRIEVGDGAPIGRIETVPEAGVEIARDGPHRFTVDWHSPVARGEQEFVLAYARPFLQERLDLFRDEGGVGYFRLLVPSRSRRDLLSAASEGVRVRLRPRRWPEIDGVLEFHGWAERSGRVSLAGTARGMPWSRSFQVSLPPRPGGEPVLRLEWHACLLESDRETIARYLYQSAEEFHRKTRCREARDNLRRLLEIGDDPVLRVRGASLLAEVEDLLNMGGEGCPRLDGELAVVERRSKAGMDEIEMLLAAARIALFSLDPAMASKRVESAAEILRWLPSFIPTGELHLRIAELRVEICQTRPGR